MSESDCSAAQPKVNRRHRLRLRRRRRDSLSFHYLANYQHHPPPPLFQSSDLSFLIPHLFSSAPPPSSFPSYDPSFHLPRATCPLSLPLPLLPIMSNPTATQDTKAEPTQQPQQQKPPVLEEDDEFEDFPVEG